MYANRKSDLAFTGRIILLCYLLICICATADADPSGPYVVDEIRGVEIDQLLVNAKTNTLFTKKGCGSSHSTVFIVDLYSNSVVGTLNAPGGMCSTIAMNRTANQLYVAKVYRYGRSEISVYDGYSYDLLHEFTHEVISYIGLAVHEKRGLLYLFSSSTTPTGGAMYGYSAVDVESFRHVGGGVLGFTNPAAGLIEMAVAGDTLYVAGHYNGKIWAIDCAKNETLGELVLPSHPMAFAVLPDSRRMYVASTFLPQSASTVLDVVDLNSLEVIATHALEGNDPKFVSLPHAQTVLMTVNNCDHTYVLNATDDERFFVVDGAEMLNTVDANLDRQRIYVASADPPGIAVIHHFREGLPPSLVATLDLGSEAESIAVNQRTGLVYVGVDGPDGKKVIVVRDPWFESAPQPEVGEELPYVPRELHSNGRPAEMQSLRN